MTTWRETVNLRGIFHNDSMTFEERKSAIIDQIRASRWYRRAEDDRADDLHDILNMLGETADEEEFDNVWENVYDLADEDRIWIATV